ncbi:MAG: radical SAM protein [Ruminococcus sp.]|nr:radical SAM protein [Ruminococcus sp.]
MEAFSYRDFTLQWHITHRCNLRCKHCYQEDYSAFDNREDAERVLDQYCALLHAYGCKGRLNITGGEPLTHPDLYRLLYAARERGIATGVLTNGTLLRAWEARKLKACGVDYVQVSLDGCQKTHDAIRGKGSFESAVQGIIALRSQGIFTSVSFTAQRQNYRDLRRLARYCDLLGADKLWFDRVIIPAEKDSGRLTLSAKEFGQLSKTAARLNRRGKVFCGRALQFIPCKDKQVYHCAAGDNLLIVLANGDVMPCRRLPFVIGNVRKTDLLTLHQNSPLMQKLRGTGIPDGCVGCRYRELCRGGAKCLAYAKTGSFDIADPDCPLAKPCSGNR